MTAPAPDRPASQCLIDQNAALLAVIRRYRERYGPLEPDDAAPTPDELMREFDGCDCMGDVDWPREPVERPGAGRRKWRAFWRGFRDAMTCFMWSAKR